MKKATVILLLIICFQASGYSWRSFSRYHLGSEANGIGGAYVGDASTEIAMNYNPAGMVQIDKNMSINYEVSTGIIIYDIFAWNMQAELDYFPFFSFLYSFGKLKAGTSLCTLFDDYNNTGLSVRSWKISAAYPVTDSISIGAGLGPVFAVEGESRGYSFCYNIGLLWKINSGFQIGLTFQSPFKIDWKNPQNGYSLQERYPYIIEGGVSVKATERILLFAALEHIGIDVISYTLDGTDNSPIFDKNILGRIHPHVGIRFLEAITGAHVSIGFMTDSAYHSAGSMNQYLLTASIRAYGKNTIFEASIIDALILSFITPYSEYEEQINVGFSFKFGSESYY